MTHERSPAIAWLHPKVPALDFNGPVVPFRPFREEWVERPALELFADAAEAFADRIACEDIDGHLTYAQIWAACRRLAAAMDATVMMGAPVGVLLPNEASYPVAVLACLAAGRPCVMIDRHHPQDRVAGIIRDAGLAAIILRRSDVVDGLLLPAGVRTIVLDEMLQDGPVPERLPSHSMPSDGPSFIVYTSGSSGRPKGIVLSQRAVLHRAAELVNAVHLRADDKVLSLASPSTIGGLQQIFEVMLSGAALVKLDLQRVGLGRVVEAVGRRRITMMFSTPAVWRSVASIDSARASLASLRCIQSSGDALLSIDLALIRRVLPADCHVLSVYGATEAPALLQWFVPLDAPDNEPRVAAGYPLADISLAALDEAGHAVADGEPGELVVRSAWMSLGLWRDGAVHPGPFERDAQNPSLPVYRTGDIVRVRRDGLFVTLGRKDRQIKILGNRVELAEIETVLKRAPGVLDAAVVARRIDAEPRLYAFVVPRDVGSPGFTAEVRSHMTDSLPAYMRPTRLFVIGEMPLLPGRKVDEEALLALGGHVPTIGQPPSPQVEARAGTRWSEAVGTAWRRTFGQPPPQDDSRFDESGGDSLRLLQLVFHLEKLCGRSLSLDRFHIEMRPSQFAVALEVPRDTPQDHPPSGLPRVLLVPGRGGDDPMLAGFRARCAASLSIHTLGYPVLNDLSRGNFGDVVTNMTAQAERIAPENPITLAGYSFGGDVAYAIAQELIARGRLVSALLILDTNAVDFEDIEQARERNGWRRRFVTLCRLVRDRQWRVIMNVALTPAVVAKPSSRWALRLLTMLKVPAAGNLAFHLGRHLREQILETHRIRWMKDTPATQLDIPVVFFRSTQNTADMGWRMRARNLTIVPVGGDHISMLSRENAVALSVKFVRAVYSISD